MNATEEPKPYVPSNQFTRLASGRLRKLADWLDAHDVLDSELVSVSTDGWDDLYIHVKANAACVAGRSIAFDERGIGFCDVNGMRLIVSLLECE